MNRTLVKRYNAGGAISKYRIVKFGADDDTVVQGAAATDSLIGVACDLDVTTGEQVDVVHGGISDVTFGGTVTRGAQVTSDASGQAVTAASTNRVIGIALKSAVSGDIAPVLLSPGAI